MWVNADHGRDFHPLADHMTKLQYFTMAEFSVFSFSLDLIFHQTLSNLIVYNLIASQKLHTKVAQTS